MTIATAEPLNVTVPRPGLAAAGPAVACDSRIGWRDCGDQPSLREQMREAAFTVLTAGLYRCWVRTRLNRRIWRSIRIDGAPLAYTGTVRDLLMPMLAAMGAIAAVVAAFAIMKHFAVPKPRLTPSPWRLLVSMPLIYLLGMAAWTKRAHLLERTRLGAAKGELHGSRHGYALTHLLTAIAMAATLGWIIPWRQVALQRRLIAGTQLGPHRLTFEARAKPLLGRFAIAWMGVIAIYLASVVTLGVTMGRKIVAAKEAGTLPALSGHEWLIVAALGAAAAVAVGLICAWYRIGAWRHMAAMTSLDGRRVRLEADTRDYLRLVITNTALRLVTGFLAAPAADLRHTQFLVQRLMCR